MSKVRVAAFSVSLDGFGAGLRQDFKNPLGVRGTEPHECFFQTEAFKKRQGQSGNAQIDDLVRKARGRRGVDNDLAERSFENIGAWILGRNMFGRDSRAVGGRFMERMVGCESAIPDTGLCAHTF